MTSEKRSWYEGATYHITARGHHRNDIFRDEEDFKIYLIILEEALLYFNNYNYEIIAYCLMDNHVHILIRLCFKPMLIIGATKVDKYKPVHFNALLI